MYNTKKYDVKNTMYKTKKVCSVMYANVFFFLKCI